MSLILGIDPGSRKTGFGIINYVSEPGANQTGFRFPFEGFDQFIKPAFGHLCIVIQQYQEFTPGFFCAAVTTADKTQVFFISQVF